MPARNAPNTAARLAEIVARLRRNYPDAECALVHDSPLELLIATILSAQCTDARVNIVTRDLFSRHRRAADFAQMPLNELERAIQSTGFFRNKAKNIRACCERLVVEHDGEVPRTLDELVALPGVGRKTANVVLGTAYGIASGVVVDTHVGRIVRRLGLTRQTDPVKVEQELMALLPKSEWILFSHRLIHHGRRLCTARSPQCEVCPLLDVCPQTGVAPTKRAPQAREAAEPARRARTVGTNRLPRQDAAQTGGRTVSSRDLGRKAGSRTRGQRKKPVAPPRKGGPSRVNYWKLRSE